jgi:PD-(D/E)XK nuclease superfamily
MTPETAAQNFHWIKYDKNSNTIELFLDNYMLSASRVCEAKFYLEHILHIRPKPQSISKETILPLTGKIIRKPWFFDFGEYIHWCLEQFYNHFKVNKSAPPVDFWINQCKMKWVVMRMDEYAYSIVEADVKKYEEVKKWEGVCGLLVQYYAYYMDQRLRVIDTEITFGHNREVLIGTIITNSNYGVTQPHGLELPLRIMCYLTGRIDLLVDNGYKIGPIDHKTTHKFDGFEHDDFNPHDGMTGYILAINEILKKYFPDSGSYTEYRPPTCHGGWIYHISATTPSTPRDKSQKPGPRFKITPIDKTAQQLEDYKARQLSSFKRIAELLFNDKTPEWNTNNCNNMFFRKCEYKPIHEQPSDQWQDIINRFYTIDTKGWDTRDHANKQETSTRSTTGIPQESVSSTVKENS